MAVAPNADAAKREATARRWNAELAAAEKAQSEWLQRAKKIAKRYKKTDSATQKDRRFAMLWSNTQTIHPAVYSRPPQPVVTRRFADQDPVARVTSEVLERCLSFSVDVHDLDGVNKQTSLDYVLIARGQSWERYEPTFGDPVTPEIALQVKSEGDGYTDEAGEAYEGEVTERDGAFYGQGQPYRPVLFEESVTDYVNWQDFLHGEARTWDEVPWVARRVYLSRKQLIDRFGEDIGKAVPLDWGPKSQGKEDGDYQKKAAVYEIWCKAERKAYWISRSWSKPLDERNDPLNLPDFWPCPRPLLGTMANDSCIPVPDYVYYQDQAEEIDVLTARITTLQNALKVRGFYAADVKTNLNNLLNSDNGIMIPVPDWQTLKDGGGVAGKVEWFPIAQVVAALNALVEQRQLLVNDVYQITGVADIMRGMNDPRATATAEKIKGAWGTLRVRTRQTEVQRFVRDQLRIKAGVIATKFGIDTLKAMSGVKLPTNAEKQQAQMQVQQGAQAYQMAVQQAQITGQQPPPQPEIPEELQATLRSPSWEDVEALLKDNALRQFRIDIETDSTIEPDQQEEKAQAVELTQAIGAFIAEWGPAIQAQPALAPLAAGILKFTIRRFRAGRELEDLIESTMDKVMNAPPPQPQGDPAAAAKAQSEQTKLQIAGINAQVKQAEIGQRAQEHADEMQIEAAQLGLEAQRQQLDAAAMARDPRPQSVQ